MMKIRVDKTKCTGCRLCEVVCSLFHSGKINAEKSAIRILKDDLDTSTNVPVLCRQCKEMTCLSGENVVEREERSKFIWDHRRVHRCPFNAIRAFGHQAFHCDLCGGTPQCVKVCTVKAIAVSRSA
jgi:carbon-monoxide dehydrogenase iron sulfur subunit